MYGVSIFWMSISKKFLSGSQESLTRFHEYYLNYHVLYCVKIVYSGPYFPAFGLTTERYGIYLRIQSKCGKIRTRITPNRDTFYAVNDSKFKISESLVSLELTSALNSSLNEYNLRIHWRLSAILKISKKVYEVMFFDMQKYAYSKSVFNTLNIEIKHEC